MTSEAIATPRSLQELYLAVNRTYLSSNFFREPLSIFAHLTEAVGAIASSIAKPRTRDAASVQPEVARAIIWWLALCGKLRVRNVEEMVWWKFPGVCPYCRLPLHVSKSCKGGALSITDEPDWAALEVLAKASADQRPSSLDEWVEMFGRIYPPTGEGLQRRNLAKLTEELGELAEAVRVHQLAPGYALAELGDVFAWLIQVLLTDRGEAGIGEDPTTLNDLIAREFPGFCRYCELPVCGCPAILPSSLGRIATSVPTGRTPLDPKLALFSVDEAMVQFGALERRYRLADKEFALSQKAFDELLVALSQIVTQIERLTADHSDGLDNLATLLGEVRGYSHFGQARLDAILREVRALSPEDQSKFAEIARQVAIGVTAAETHQLLETVGDLALGLG